MRWYTNGGLESSPFSQHHCVPIAWANVKDVGRTSRARFAVELAESAYIRLIPGWGVPMLKRRGSAIGGCEELWAALARMRIVQTVKWAVVCHTDDRTRRIGRPTVAQFARSHPRGRWVVFTRGHAQAVVSGRYRGRVGPRSRVRLAIRVEEIE